jgi:hypothetical protein
MGRTPLALELLQALRDALDHLKNLRTFDPKDKLISDLKRSIHEKIEQLEERESGRNRPS